MSAINGQSKAYDVLIRPTLPVAPPEAPEGDETEKEIKVSVANKTDVFVGKLVGGTSLTTTTVKGDATAAALEAAKMAAKTLSTSPEVTEGVVKGAAVVSGAVAAAKGDHFSAAMSAKKVLESSPTLKPLTVVADAVMIATGDKKLDATIQEVKKEAKKVVSPLTTNGDRVKSALKLAQHTQSGVILTQQLHGALKGLGAWLSKFHPFKGLIEGLGTFGKSIAASPLGKAIGKLGKLMPVVNLAALANSVRIAVDIWRDPRSSKTSKALVAGSVASGAVIFGATLVTGGAALVPAAAAFGVATELGLMVARKRDVEVGNTDAQVAHYLTHPVDGMKAVGKAAKETAADFGNDFKNVAKKLGDKLTGRESEKPAEAKTDAAGEPAPLSENVAPPSGMLGAVPEFTN